LDVGNAVLSKFSSLRTGELCNFVTQVMKFGRGPGWKKNWFPVWIIAVQGKYLPEVAPP
jgi:hypothetical protein